MYADSRHSYTTQDRRKIATYIDLLQQQGEDLRRPVVDYVGDKLYELRPGAHRLRTDQLPDMEKRVALSRMADLIRRNERGQVWLREAT